MRDGIAGGPTPSSIPFADDFDEAGAEFNLSPILLAAIAAQESGYDPNAVSDDGGHGLMQLTSSYPDSWADPLANILYACAYFIVPAYAYWVGQGLQGDDLIKCVGASYNAGLQGAIDAHASGDVDSGTTDNYGARLVAGYHKILVLATESTP